MGLQLQMILSRSEFFFYLMLCSWSIFSHRKQLFLHLVIQMNSISGFRSIFSLQDQMLYQAILFSPLGTKHWQLTPLPCQWHISGKYNSTHAKCIAFMSTLWLSLAEFFSGKKHCLGCVNISICYVLLARFFSSLPLNGNLACSNPWAAFAWKGHGKEKVYHPLGWRSGKNVSYAKCVGG